MVMKWHYILYLLLLIILNACATTHPKIEQYLSSISQEPPPFIKAKFSLTIVSNGENNSIDAVALVAPNERYRIEFYGPLGIHVGSFLWKYDQWQLYIPDEERVMTGSGPIIALPNIPAIDVHRLMGLFWNQLLPKGWNTAGSEATGSQHTLTWSDSQYRYSATIDQKSGEVERVHVEYNGALEVIHYSDYASLSSYILPQTTTHTLSNGSSLTIHLSSINLSKKEKEKYWTLKLPEDVTIN
ncbi:MAG: DUF4292 domain-containing protein [Fibrobacterales bacterium]